VAHLFGELLELWDCNVTYTGCSVLTGQVLLSDLHRDY